MTKLLKDSNERWYGVCLKHKQIMNEENLKKHRKKGCQVVISEFKHRYKHKINKHWAAKSVAEKHGMKIYTRVWAAMSQIISIHIPFGRIWIGLSIFRQAMR